MKAGLPSSVAASAAVELFAPSGPKPATGRQPTGAKARQRLLVSASALALAFAFNAAVAPQPAWAVECANGGAGPNPAGNDGGVAANTACGDGADASGASSSNTATGSLANASGDISSNAA